MKSRTESIKLITVVILSTVFFSILFAWPSWAAGGAYVSDTYLEVAEGSTATIAVGVENGAGSYSVSASGTVTAKGSGWLDNEAATISIFGAGVGTGKVTIYFDTLATYDEEELDGTKLTVEVNVYEPDTGYSGGEKGNESEQPAEEETTAAEETEPDKLEVTIGKTTYKVLDDLKGVKTPKGFEKKEGTWNGETVAVLTYGDELTLYALRSKSDDKVTFRVLSEDGKTFETPRQIRQNSITYYLLDLKKNMTVPEGFAAKDLTVSDQKIEGLVSTDAALSDFYYIRALAEGEEGIYSYDTVQGSIQRSADFMDREKTAEPETKEDEAKTAASSKEQLLKILLVIAAVIIIGLAVALIVVFTRKRKTHRRGKRTLEDIYPDEDE